MPSPHISYLWQGCTLHASFLTAGKPSSARSAMFIVRTAPRRRAKLRRSDMWDRTLFMPLPRSLVDRVACVAKNMAPLMELSRPLPPAASRLNPKPENRIPKETRIPKPESPTARAGQQPANRRPGSDLGLRPSFELRPSGFGFQAPQIGGSCHKRPVLPPPLN